MLGEAPLEGARARPIGADSGSDRRSQLGLARVETRATAPKRFTLNQTFRESRAQLWRAGVVNEAAGEVGHTIPRSQWGDRTTLFCPPHGVARAYRVPIRGSAISLQIRYARIWAPHTLTHTSCRGRWKRWHRRSPRADGRRGSGRHRRSSPAPGSRSARAKRLNSLSTSSSCLSSAAKYGEDHLDLRAHVRVEVERRVTLSEGETEFPARTGTRAHRR